MNSQEINTNDTNQDNPWETLPGGGGDLIDHPIFFLPIAALLISIGYLLVQIFIWMKTAEWCSFSFHKSLVDVGLINQYFYINIPNALGIQKILNWFLFSSATFAYFILSIFLWLLCLGILEEKNKT